MCTARFCGTVSHAIVAFTTDPTLKKSTLVDPGMFVYHPVLVSSSFSSKDCFLRLTELVQNEKSWIFFSTIVFFGSFTCSHLKNCSVFVAVIPFSLQPVETQISSPSTAYVEYAPMKNRIRRYFDILYLAYFFFQRNRCAWRGLNSRLQVQSQAPSLFTLFSNSP